MCQHPRALVIFKDSFVLSSFLLSSVWAPISGRFPLHDNTTRWQLQVQIYILFTQLKEGMATYSNILAWRIPWTEEPAGLTFLRTAKSQTQLKRLGTCEHTQLEVYQNGSSSFPNNSSKRSGITSLIICHIICPSLSWLLSGGMLCSDWPCLLHTCSVGMGVLTIWTSPWVRALYIPPKEEMGTHQARKTAVSYHGVMQMS